LHYTKTPRFAGLEAEVEVSAVEVSHRGGYAGRRKLEKVVRSPRFAVVGLSPRTKPHLEVRRFECYP
jgi:hypothetical protein